MSEISINRPVYNRHELHHQVKVAITRIADRDKPMILTWNGEKLVALSTDARRAARALEQPTCLGVYDFESTAEQIFSDLLAVLSRSRPT